MFSRNSFHRREWWWMHMHTCSNILLILKLNEDEKQGELTIFTPKNYIIYIDIEYVGEWKMSRSFEKKEEEKNQRARN